MAVQKPLDDLFRITKTQLLVDDIQETRVPGVEGSVIEAESSYVLKARNMFGFPIDSVHPAWLYSADDYKVPDLKGDVIFRMGKVGKGLKLPLFIPNVKQDTLVTSLAGTPTNPGVEVSNQVPITYTGEVFPSSVDTSPNILTAQLDTTKFRIVEKSPTEWEIHVLAELTVDTSFSIPISSPKLGNFTIFGEVGTDSNLPEDAVVGIVQARTEAKLSAEHGTWLVTGDDLAALSKGTSTLLSNSTTVYTSPGATPGEPAWYTNFVDLVQQTPQWLRIKTLADNDTPYYALGFISKTSTCGTGIFISNQNKVNVLPWKYSANGIQITREFINTKTLQASTTSVASLLDCSSFIDAIKQTVSYELVPVPAGTVLPIVANTLQVTAVNPTLVRNTTARTFLYQYPTYKYTCAVTPLFSPTSMDSHMYVPELVLKATRRWHNIQYNQLNSNIDLYLRVKATLPTIHDDGCPHDILDAPGIFLTVPDNPCLGKDKDQMGFTKTKTYNMVPHTNNNGTHTGDYHTWTASASWVNAPVLPTIGAHTTPTLATATPGISITTMLLVGFFKAGTAAGVYSFKPFSSHTNLRGALDAKTAEASSYNKVATIRTESTELPYLGLNIINIQTPKYKWECPEQVDDPAFPSVTAINVLQEAKKETLAIPTVTTLQTRLLLKDVEVPLIGYPTAKRPVVVDVTLDGIPLDEIPDLITSAPFVSKFYDGPIVVVATNQMAKFYIMRVTLDASGGIARYDQLITSIPFWQTPFGIVDRILGVAHTEDINYHDGKETDIVLLYVALKDVVNGYTGLAVVGLRDDFVYDSHRDTIIRVPIEGPASQEYDIAATDIWPNGIAVMYPHVYIPAYYYAKTPTAPIDDPLLDLPSVSNLQGAGWQMCIYRIDLLAGLVGTKIPIKSCDTMRFTYGLPAKNTDFRQFLYEDQQAIGDYSKYLFGPNNPWTIPTSTVLPQVGSWDFPTLAGLCSVSGMLIAVHNGIGKPVGINPVTGYIEECGFSIYPFSAPFNASVDVAKEKLTSTYNFQGVAMTGTHPFMHVCVGDGLTPSPYSTSIDIQNASFGTTLLRPARLRNNLLRDVLQQAKIIVPPETELPHSGMLWVSLSPTGPWTKEVTFSDDIPPCGAVPFYIKVQPTAEIQDPVTLYFNVSFLRKTVFFGYKFLD